MRRRVVVALLLGVAPAVPSPDAAETPWVFVARRALGRIEQLRHESPSSQPSTAKPAIEIVTVMLDAPAARVYATALGVARRNKPLQISEDAPHRRFDVSEGLHHVTLSVTSLSDNVSQLLIVASVLPGQESDASRAVDAVLRVCRELRKTCTVQR